MFLNLRKMTLDKSPSGVPIEPQVENTEDGSGDGLHDRLPLRGGTARVRDSKETDVISSPSVGDLADSDRLKAVPIETSVELEAQRRDIDGLSTAVRRMEKDISQMKDVIQKLRSEAITRSNSSALSRREGSEYPVAELELLTANITRVGAKANGIDGLKLEFEMMKRRIKRMEDANIATQSTSTLAAFPHQTSQKTPQGRAPRPSEERSQQQRTETLLDSDQSGESDVYQPESWSPNDGCSDRGPSVTRSSEGPRNHRNRPRSSTLDEPLSPGERDEPDGRKAYGSERKGSEMQEKDQAAKLKASPRFITPAKRHAPKATEQFFSYDVPIIDNSQDDDYIPGARSTVVRGTSGSPKTRGRGRGRGRGGRPRTSLNPRRYGTPEWEKPDWVNGAGNNERATGSRTASGRGGGVARRGTGGGSYSEPRRGQGQDDTDRRSPPEDTEVHRLTPSSTGGGSSTIRPRDQRQRDSEGYLLTAKGTRDGRSKFWKDVGAGLQPNPNVSEDTRVANASRHAKIMQKIFPDGVEEGKRRSNLAQQLFSNEKGPDRTNGDVDMQKTEET